MKSVAKQLPLAQVTLRKYELSQKADDWEIVKKFCLSIGLLNPGDSRDVIVDILHVILFCNKSLTALEIKDRVESLREKTGRKLHGTATSNILRQLRRLKEALVLEKSADCYRLSENESLSSILENKVLQYRVQSITFRIKEYAQLIDERRLKKFGEPHV